MVMTEDEISRHYRVRKTVMQMLSDRGYEVDDSEIDMSRSQFVEKYGAGMTREGLLILKGLRSKNSNSKNSDSKNSDSENSDKIYVFFPDDPKVGVKPIKNYARRMKEEGVNRAIVVVQQGLTPFARTIITDMSSKYQLESFLEAELLTNIKDHILVPPHQLLTPEEKKALLQTYTVKDTQLPRILMTDPIARYYGLRRGQVVRIIRPSETAGQYITYRFVV